MRLNSLRGKVPCNAYLHNVHGADDDNEDEDMVTIGLSIYIHGSDDDDMLGQCILVPWGTQTCTFTFLTV